MVSYLEFPPSTTSHINSSLAIKYKAFCYDCQFKLIENLSAFILSLLKLGTISESETQKEKTSYRKAEIYSVCKQLKEVKTAHSLPPFLIYNEASLVRALTMQIIMKYWVINAIIIFISLSMSF